MFGTKIINVIKALTDYGIVVSTYDPVAKTGGSLQGIRYKTYKEIPAENYGAVVLGVSHTSFLSLDITSQKPLSVVYDIKGILGSKRMVVYKINFTDINLNSLLWKSIQLYM
jgi:UDP-N-acetyl-D-galactosamine dehydrogenase